MRLCRRSLCNLFAREPPDEFGVAAPWDETRLPSATCNPPLLLLILYRVFYNTITLTLPGSYNTAMFAILFQVFASVAWKILLPWNQLADVENYFTSI